MNLMFMFMRTTRCFLVGWLRLVFSGLPGNPCCMPRRASVVTGRYPHQTGVTQNAPPPAWFEMRLTLHVILRLEQALGFDGVARLETGLDAGDFFLR